MTVVDLDRAEALAAAATPGPWHISDLHNDAVIVPRSSGHDDLDKWYGGQPISESSNHADAEFIAAARQLVPALVARVRELEARTALFAAETFTSHSGLTLHWKIECDALTPADWAGVARIAVDHLPPFGAVEGVPRGGLPFADALAPYATEGPLLIVDDVCTTGRSLEDHRAGRDAAGMVLFARGPCPAWVTLLFSLPNADRVRELTDAGNTLAAAAECVWQNGGPVNQAVAVWRNLTANQEAAAE